MLPCAGQDDSDSSAPAPRALPVVGAQQDAEAAREKLLKAADELDMIQSNAEANRVAVDAMKSDVSQLQASNADLKQQLASLQAAFDKAEAERTKERQVLVDEVAQLVASRSAGSAHSGHKHDPDSATAETSPASGTSPSAEVHHASSNDSAGSSAPDLNPPADPDPEPAPRPQKGYYHVVESGETLTMICAAYRDQGVKVSISQVRKANGMTSKSTLKVGQKLFIPKPT